MKGKINMPLEAVLALVHMVKARQQDLRNHTKLDPATGWTVRSQTWHEIATELNRRYGRELTVDQCMKKFLNIKSMTKTKLEDQEKRRQKPGMEQFTIRLTPAEQEYIRLFHRGAPPNPPVPDSTNWDLFQMLLGDTNPPNDNNSSAEQEISLKGEYLEEEEEQEGQEEDDNGEDDAGTMSGRRTPTHIGAQRSAAGVRVTVEAGDNLTNAILGILPQPQQYTDTGPTNNNNDSKGHLRQEQPQQQPADQQLPSSSGSSLHHLHGGQTTFPDHLHNHQRGQPSTGGQGLRNVPTTGTSGGGRNIVVQQQHNTGRMVREQEMRSLQSAHQQHLMPASEHPNHNGNKLLLGNPRKRRALQAQHLLLNGFAGDCSADGAESVELRLKRLKCELIEKQLLDLERQEEWRLKQEFMLGRQTAAMENIVIQLRQIKEKLK